MGNRANTRAYDIFKLVIALLLLILFILLLLRGNPAKLAANPQTETFPTVAPTALPPYPPATYWNYDADRMVLLNQDAAAVYQLDVAMSEWVPIIPNAISTGLSSGFQVEKDAAGQWVIFAKDGSILYRWDPMKMQWAAEQKGLETGLPSPMPGAAVSPTQEPTTVSTIESTPVSPTNVPESQTQPSSTPAAPSDNVVSSGECPLALPSRVKVSDTIKLTTALNMRTSSKMEDNLILLNPFGSQLKIIGGPECTPYLSGAYIFWQVERSDGQTGWSAEGSLTGNLYFMEPVP